MNIEILKKLLVKAKYEFLDIGQKYIMYKSSYEFNCFEKSCSYRKDKIIIGYINFEQILMYNFYYFFGKRVCQNEN